jgi:ABC-type glycerol-3-phosphate transport system permease component
MGKNFDISKMRRSLDEKIVFILAFVVFAVYTLTIIFLFVWIILASLKTNREFIYETFGFPDRWLFNNYILAFEKLKVENTNLFGMFYNSLWLNVGSTVLSMIMVSTTGYVFAKYRFPGKEVVFNFVIFTMIIPLMGNLPAMYKLVYDMNINDSPLFLITALGGFGGNFLIMYAFFKSVDWSYAESSFIDGGGHFLTYCKVMFPLARGPIFALGILSLISGWNDYLTPMLYLSKTPTLATGLYTYKLEMDYASNNPVYFAGVIMSILPVIFLFAVFSHSIMNNVIIGGLKG